MEHDKLYAVLTGDLVKSSKLDSDEFQSVKDCLKKAVEKLDGLIKSIPQKLVKGEIDFYRGDGWQLLLTQPKYALRACLFLRAYLKAHSKGDTRISVGIGRVDHIDPRQISLSTGKAFEISGKTLDELKTRRQMTAAFPYYMEGKYDNLISVFELCDVIIQGWTEKQAEAISWALHGLNQSQIAEKIDPGIKPQNVGKHLREAGWYALEWVLKRTEELDMWTL